MPQEAEWKYVLNFYGPTIRGRQTTTAKSEQQAVKNVVFRIVRQSYPSASEAEIAQRALPLASRIYNDKAYAVDDQQLVLPVASPFPTKEPVHPDIQEEVQKVRRGLEQYPENPDEPEDQDV